MAFARQLIKGNRKELAILRRAENEKCYGAPCTPPNAPLLHAREALRPSPCPRCGLHEQPVSAACPTTVASSLTLAFWLRRVPATGVQVATNVIDEGVRAGEMAAEAGADFLDLNVGKSRRWGARSGGPPESTKLGRREAAAALLPGRPPERMGLPCSRKAPQHRLPWPHPAC